MLGLRIYVVCDGGVRSGCKAVNAMTGTGNCCLVPLVKMDAEYQMNEGCGS